MADIRMLYSHRLDAADFLDNFAVFHYEADENFSSENP